MGLFNVIPANFFSVLVSGNREVYVEALMLLHRTFTYELNIRVDDYISALISLLEDRAFVPEEDDEVQESSLTPSGKARLILNRLIKAGWVDREYMDGSFVEIITPRSYAIKVMKLLSELEENAVHEYNSLVFATFSGLKQAREEDETLMYEALLSAKANTEQLEYELRTLYHGIRSFLRSIQEQHDVNLLLQNHFEEYKRMSDRIYHPIKTMDSVHRYMNPILRILSEVQADERLMQIIRDRAMTVKKFSDEGEAEREILSAMDYVQDAYQSVGGIVNEIDRKHSTYTKSSIEKIQYLMTADQTIKGKLVELISGYANAQGSKREKIGDMLDRNIRVNRQEFFDGKSLYHKNVRSRRLDTAPLPVEQDPEFSDRAMAGMLEQIKSGYPISRIREYVERLFAGGATEIRSEEIALGNDSEFILLLLAIVRADERGMQHTVEIEEGHTMLDGYRIPKVILRRKEGKVHVE